jgi:hydrogenase maturation protease
MTTRGSTLLVGLGSPYGDDQIGWRVAEAIEEKHLPGLRVCRASSPLDLLGWLENVDRLVVCDACQGGGQVGSWHRWCWPSDEIAPLKFRGSHDLGLSAALDLAERLGQLPRQVTIWAVEGKSAASGAAVPEMTMSAEVEQALPQIIGLIQNELSHA